MDAAAELGRNPVSSHHIQPEHGDEQADAGRDSRTHLARPNILRRERGQGKIHFPCSADHEQDWQPYVPKDLIVLFQAIPDGQSRGQWCSCCCCC